MGVIQALYIILVPPPLNRVSEMMNGIIFLVVFIVMPIALNIFFTIKILSSKPEYIKFQYTVLPFISYLIVNIFLLFIVLPLFVGSFIEYVAIFTGRGWLGFNTMLYSILVFLMVSMIFATSIVSYVMLLKYKNKKM